MLHIFEDNEAVVIMIIKGISPTMRHVSRTHRIALDWLFENLSHTPTRRRIDNKRTSHVMGVTNFIFLT